MSDQNEAFHREASTAYLRGDFKSATEAWERVLETDPTDERAEEGVRLCKQLIDGIDPALSAGAEPVAMADDVVPLDMELSADVASAPAPALDNSAANELTRRVDALLETAREQAAADQRDSALRTLGRILILDEENKAAQKLDAELRSDDATAPSADADSKERKLGEGLDLSAVDDSGTESVLTNVWKPPVEEAATETPEGCIPLKLQPEAATEPEPGNADSPEAALPRATNAPVPTKKFALPPWLEDRRVQLGAGGALLLLLVFGGMQFLGGEDAPPVNEPLPTKNAARHKPKATIREQPDAADPAAATQAALKPVSLADPRKLMDQGEEAYARGDFAAAVVAFGNVLKQVPEDAGVRARLNAAGQRYREQEGVRKRWDEAVAAFANKNFAEALRLFYRMDQADYRPDLKRIKVNGWYNHGVIALQTNRCDEAWDHFSEARSLDALDEAILDALELARACDAPALQAASKSLSFRGLED